MGSAVSLVGCIGLHLPDGPTKWYLPDSQESLQWRSMQTFFGQGRNKPYNSGSQTRGSFNRRGNKNGELAGRLVFYTKAVETTNYSHFPGTPHIRLKEGSKLFAKTFFDAPLGRMPVGENNLVGDVFSRGFKGHGSVLLTMVPKLCAIFVTINDNPVVFEHFCAASANAMRKARQKDPTSKSTADSSAEELSCLNEAVPGSFFTYCIPRQQDEYCFMHFPLLANFHDSLFHTGEYGQTLVQVFYSLITTLGLGTHKLSMNVQIYYDHSTFHYFPLDKNINACGVWHCGLPSSALKSPYPDASEIVSTADPLAMGSCSIEVPGAVENLYRHLLDCKPPREKYVGDDIEEIRMEAKSVAAARFGRRLKLDGLPNAVVLTSQLQRRRLCDKETGYRYHYDYVEFTALWYNQVDSSQHALGYMARGCMARGEITPRRSIKTWAWIALHDDHNQKTTPPIYRIKNKYIREANLTRRRQTWASAIHKAAMMGRITNQFMGIVRKPDDSPGRRSRRRMTIAF